MPVAAAHTRAPNRPRVLSAYRERLSDALFPLNSRVDLETMQADQDIP